MINGATKLPTATGEPLTNPEPATEAPAAAETAQEQAGEQVNTGTNLFPEEPAEEPAIGEPRKEWVRCDLTTEQRSELASEMAKILATIDSRRDAFKEEAKEHRDGLKLLEAKLLQARRGVEFGTMDRLIDVKDEPRDLVMATVRCDNGKVIRTRPLTDAERQLTLEQATADTAEETGIGRKGRGRKKKASTTEPTDDAAPPSADGTDGAGADASTTAE